jgi:LmbE family N-acetylglucosaminyl deacetylase
MAKQLRVIAFGAHPDDCEYYFGGTASLYLARGDAVKFVAATNGNAGHQSMGRAELAAARAREVARVSEASGVEYEILPNDDARLVADLRAREQFICVMRRYRPDIVFTHRTCDYHPDHRNTGLLVQDASYLLGVPAVCPDVPCLRRAPAILLFCDSFTRPTAFRADVAVDIDGAIDEKVKMLDCHKTQFYEWLPWDGHYGPAPDGDAERLRWLKEATMSGDAKNAARYRACLAKRYGRERGERVKTAEAFEISEYGAPMPEEKIREYFPF